MFKLKNLLLAPAVVALFVSAHTQVMAQTAGAQATETIVVGLDDNFPPMGFRDEKNQIVGFDIDMAREVAKRLNVDAQFRPIDWSAKEAELNSKRVDVLWNGLTITDERKKHIGFTAPYMENHQIIVVLAKSDIANKADLAGKVVGAQEGSSAVDAIGKDESSKSFKQLKTFGDNITAMMDLGTGRLDAVVLDEVVGRYYVAKRGNEFKVLQDHFGTEEYGVGTRKDDAALLKRVDDALAEMKKDGTAQKISEQWFGANVIK
ncbi:amino acid ABC transporter substrate-binding protein [Lampropedia aestuarii]|uniref:Amino acid ABC transporter substrate-binding protein n=1 Tax=Lampropedia aestuarii TaxID=2562762 RepID=A0A4S5BXU1_9BURK|nr:amino acid ABC transporter substrate-binding protein [Lampropedia aestuarii]THJ34888.1 amino acid ABC transporter substrate-binding protein [Lampropedia aestuarii]